MCVVQLQGLLPNCANGQAFVSVHQMAVSTLALDVQRLFDFPCTPFLLIVNDLSTVPRNFVARLDHMLCDRGPLRTLLLHVPFVLLQTLVTCAPSNARHMLTIIVRIKKKFCLSLCQSL